MSFSYPKKETTTTPRRARLSLFNKLMLGLGYATLAYLVVRGLVYIDVLLGQYVK